MHQAPPPDYRVLLLPLLACLPASFASPKPPPALLPLLSPVLRQRVNFLSTGSSGSSGWLPLLSWDAHRGAKLPETVERMDLEPHPVSGELELDATPPAKYQRLDAETLHARLEVHQFGLLPIYLWCESDEQGGEDAGWKLAELRSLEDMEDGSRWYNSQVEAEDASVSASYGSAAAQIPRVPSIDTQQAANGNDDNDDYWASYDRTPGATPAHGLSPAPPQSTYQTTHWTDSKAETDYYNRYGAEVQPAMDAHDPDEDAHGFHESTLNGDSLFQTTHQVTHDTSAELSMPRPITPASSHSSVDKLEARAEAMSRSSSAAEDRAQLAIKQHISTDIKSLFRLAKASGMDRAEFERVVQTELGILSLLEQDE